MSTTQQAQSTGAWSIDKVHSSVVYEIDHNSAATFRGAFRDVDANLEYGEDTIKIHGSVRVESIDLVDEQQKSHVLSPEFFDAARYPTIDFASTEVSFEAGEAVVAGTLTIRGETKPVTVHGKIGETYETAHGQQGLSLRLETTIDRTQYGLDWQLTLPNGNPVLGDDVKITVELELVQE